MPETPSCCCLPQDAPFRTYEDVIRHLDALNVFHIDLGLGRMKQALDGVGIQRFHCPAVQVAGTNGKGSISTFLQAIAMAHGMNAGLYTSPHFLNPEERIHMNERPLPRSVWPALAGDAVKAQKGLTYFELLTVMAAQAFQASDAQLMIFEAGLGGRSDATTALPVDMACFAPIGLDHRNILGSTLEAIADNKSDILRPGVTLAVSAPQPPSVRDILVRKAAAQGIPLCFVPSGKERKQELWADLPQELRDAATIPDGTDLGLRGPHQYENARTAALAWVLLCRRYGWTTDRKTIARGLKEAFIPGRLQFAPARGSRPALWLDGAHNAHGMKALGAAVQTMTDQERPGAVVFSCLADKEPKNLVVPLLGFAADLPLFVPSIRDNPRAAAGTDLLPLLGSLARAVPDTAEALEAARQAADGRPVLVCGSLFLLAEVYALYPDLLERTR